jgi:hypothetical protein
MMLMLKLSPLVMATSNQVSRGVALADGMNRKCRKTVFLGLFTWAVNHQIQLSLLPFQDAVPEHWHYR